MGDVLWKMSAAGRMGPLWGVTRPGVASVTNSGREESQGLFWDIATDSGSNSCVSNALEL